MSQSSDSNKQRVLNDDGLRILNDRLRGQTDIQVATKAGLDRNTIAKIRNRTGPVNLSSLEKLFQAFDLALKDCHYCQWQAPQHSEPKRSSRSSQGIPLPTFPFGSAQGTPTPELPPQQQLKETLFTLNYRSQKNRFEAALSEEWEPENTWQGGYLRSFLIYGEASRGQRWLVNRLVNSRFRRVATVQKIPITLQRHQTHIDHLWQKLAEALRTDRTATPDQLVERAYQQWQQTDLIVVLYNLHYLSSSDLGQILTAFWCPLVDRIQTDANGINESDLILFLVLDSNPNSVVTTLGCATQADRYQLHQPIALPPLDCFSQRTLKDWLKTEGSVLPTFADLSTSPDWIEHLWRDACQGIPDLVLRQICQDCNCSFDHLLSTLDL